MHAGPLRIHHYRVYVGGLRVHHGLTGALLAILARRWPVKLAGLLLVWHDHRDFPWPVREPR